MSITGIDAITYGVEDPELCRRFFGDWGLTPKGEDFETLNGCEVGVEGVDTGNDVRMFEDDITPIAAFARDCADVPNNASHRGKDFIGGFTATIPSKSPG